MATTSIVASLVSNYYWGIVTDAGGVAATARKSEVDIRVTVSGPTPRWRVSIAPASAPAQTVKIADGAGRMATADLWVPPGVDLTQAQTLTVEFMSIGTVVSSATCPIGGG